MDLCDLPDRPRGSSRRRCDRRPTGYPHRAIFQPLATVAPSLWMGVENECGWTFERRAPSEPNRSDQNDNAGKSTAGLGYPVGRRPQRRRLLPRGHSNKSHKSVTSKSFWTVCIWRTANTHRDARL